MGEKFQEDDAPEQKFQTAFPEDTEPTFVECQYGCGQPGKYFGAGPQGGELPRCSRQISDCPVMGGAARRAARRAGRIPRR